MASYEQGQTAVLSVNFYDYTGGPAADVTGLTVTITPMAGGGAVLGPTSTGVVHVATGLYSYSYAVPTDLAVGDYAVIWNGVDSSSIAVQATETITITATTGVVVSGWKPDYITLQEGKNYVKLSDTVDDAEVANAITAASRSVDRTAQRQFGKVASLQARTYTAEWDRHRCKHTAVIDDLMDTTGLTVVDTLGNTFDNTQYTLLPVNNPSLGRPYERIDLPGPGDYVLAALWGWTAFPAPIVLATKLQMSRFLARRDSPYGVAGSPTEGSEIRLLSKVDPDVAVSIQDYVRRWWSK